MSSGNIEKPANAIPGRAQAMLQLRFVVGTRVEKVVDVIGAHLQAKGFPMIEVRATQSFAASRTDFDSPWINWAVQSIRQTTGTAPAVLPNFGGSLPNDVFPTLWACRRSGYRIPIRAARSTRPMNTSCSRLPRKRSASWRGCSGSGQDAAPAVGRRPRSTSRIRMTVAALAGFAPERGRMTAESHILFRPDLCKHYRSHPNQEPDE